MIVKSQWIWLRLLWRIECDSGARIIPLFGWICLSDRYNLMLGNINVLYYTLFPSQCTYHINNRLIVLRSSEPCLSQDHAQFKSLELTWDNLLIAAQESTKIRFQHQNIEVFRENRHEKIKRQFNSGNLIKYWGAEAPACVGDAASVGSMRFDNYISNSLKLWAAPAAWVR